LRLNTWELLARAAEWKEEEMVDVDGSCPLSCAFF
jgi:hypothetical protein